MTIAEKFLNEKWENSLNTLEKKLNTVVQYKLLCPKCNKEEVGEKDPEKSARKTYTLKVPRPQYDRISEAFKLKETYFVSFDPEEDTVTFKINEKQRATWTDTYYLSEMFLPENIKSYTV